MKRTMWLLAVVALVGACGGDDGGGDGDGDGDGDLDAAVDAPASSSILGQICGPGADCPTDHVCVIQNVPTGSTTQGYCSPMCVGDGQCTDGYSGPGNPVCFRSECTIVCTDMCPTGLTCQMTGGPTDVCAVPGP